MHGIRINLYTCNFKNSWLILHKIFRLLLPSRKDWIQISPCREFWLRSIQRSPLCSLGGAWYKPLLRLTLVGTLQFSCVKNFHLAMWNVFRLLTSFYRRLLVHIPVLVLWYVHQICWVLHWIVCTCNIIHRHLGGSSSVLSRRHRCYCHHSLILPLLFQSDLLWHEEWKMITG